VWGGNPEPQRGSFTVTHSIFRNLASGVPLNVVDGYRAKISHNFFENVYLGGEVSDIRNTRYEFSHNRVADAFIGIDIYDSGVFPFGVESSGLMIEHNRFRSALGVLVEPTFGEDVVCLLRGNNVSQVDDLPIFLGDGTYGCKVIPMHEEDEEEDP